MPKENVIGNKYAMLTVIEDAPYIGPYRRRVRCACECGGETTTSLSNLKSGHTKSCGCHNDKMRKISQVTHGMTYTNEYKSYRKMIERCTDTKEIGYHNYGGRGITVCERWLEGFENFFADMGNKPTPSHSIERMETNGNYEPGNCKWATKKEQNNNRTNNSRYEYAGMSMTQAQWSEHLGIPSSKIVWHLRNGRSFGDIVEFVKKNGCGRMQFNKTYYKYWPRKNKKAE